MKVKPKRENEAEKLELSLGEIDFGALKKEKTERKIRMHQFKKKMKTNMFGDTL